MALIFLAALINLPFQVLTFNKSDCLDFIANDKWLLFTQPQSTGLSGLGALLSRNTCCNRSQNQFQILKTHFS